jgi:hypothetical protein
MYFATNQRRLAQLPDAERQRLIASAREAAQTKKVRNRKRTLPLPLAADDHQQVVDDPLLPAAAAVEVPPPDAADRPEQQVVNDSILPVAADDDVEVPPPDAADQPDPPHQQVVNDSSLPVAAAVDNVENDVEVEVPPPDAADRPHQQVVNDSPLPAAAAVDNVDDAVPQQQGDGAAALNPPPHKKVRHTTLEVEDAIDYPLIKEDISEVDCEEIAHDEESLDEESLDEESLEEESLEEESLDEESLDEESLDEESLDEEEEEEDRARAPTCKSTISKDVSKSTVDDQLIAPTICSVEGRKLFHAQKALERMQRDHQGKGLVLVQRYRQTASAKLAASELGRSNPHQTKHAEKWWNEEENARCNYASQIQTVIAELAQNHELAAELQQHFVDAQKYVQQMERGAYFNQKL